MTNLSRNTALAYQVLLLLCKERKKERKKSLTCASFQVPHFRWHSKCARHTQTHMRSSVWHLFLADNLLTAHPPVSSVMFGRHFRTKEMIPESINHIYKKQNKTKQNKPLIFNVGVFVCSLAHRTEQNGN